MTGSISPYQGNVVRHLPVRFPSRRQLADNYLASAPYGGLVVPASAEIASGELALLSVQLEHENLSADLLGTVLWVRRAGRQHLAGVGFLASEVEGRERLLGGGQRPGDGERRERRWPLSLAVSFYDDGGFVLARSRNLSPGGMCIESVSSPRGQAVFNVFPGAARPPVALRCRVVWSRPGSAFGLQVAEDDPSLPDYRRVVAKLASRLDS